MSRDPRSNLEEGKQHPLWVRLTAILSETGFAKPGNLAAMALGEEFITEEELDALEDEPTAVLDLIGTRLARATGLLHLRNTRN